MTDKLTMEMIDKMIELGEQEMLNPPKPTLTPFKIGDELYFFEDDKCFKCKWPRPKWADYLESRGIGIKFACWGKDRVPEYDYLVGGVRVT